MASIQNIASPPDNHRNLSFFDKLGSSLHATDKSQKVQKIRLLEHKIDCLQFEVLRVREENEKLKTQQNSAISSPVNQIRDNTRQPVDP